MCVRALICVFWICVCWVWFVISPPVQSFLQSLMYTANTQILKIIIILLIFTLLGRRMSHTKQLPIQCAIKSSVLFNCRPFNSSTLLILALVSQCPLFLSTLGIDFKALSSDVRNHSVDIKGCPAVANINRPLLSFLCFS